MCVAEAFEAGFLPTLDEDQADMLPRGNCACTYTLRTTPGISWVIPVYLVISLFCQLDYS